MRSLSLLTLCVLILLPSPTLAARITAPKASKRQVLQSAQQNEHQFRQSVGARRTAAMKELRYSELDERKTFMNKQMPFTFTFPKEWLQSDAASMGTGNKRMGRVISQNANGDIRSGNAVAFAIDRNDMTNDALWTMAQRQLGLEGTLVAEQVRVGKYDTLQAHYGENDTSKEQGWLVLITSSQRYGYVLFFRARNAAGFAANEEIFRHILSTFKAVAR